ncbi:MAG: ThuA domain-containing protein [Caldilineaceae bacterium]|nr:ThuA domain-containing protein [Caldilineaceae bacterium]
MQTLVLADDRYHPAHIARAGLGALGDQAFTFDWLENANDWSAARMATYPLVVLVKANNVSATDETKWMTPAVEAALRDHVRAGNGLLVIHSGTAGYRETTVLRELLGGVFERHPKQCPVTVEPQANHPLTMGSTPFTLVDEHYFMEMTDVPVDCFLHSHSEHGTQPAGWTRTEGDGRVCVLTPGHHVEVWLHPAYQTLLQNSLRWCGKIA